MTPEVKTILNQMRCGFIPNGYQKTILGIAPKTWKKARIDEICKLSSGSTPRRNDAKNYSGDILWVTSGELKNREIVDTAEKVSEKAAIDSHLQMYEPGTVVIAIYGLEAAGIRGTASIVGKRCTISQACMAFTDFQDVDNTYFYYWYLNQGQVIGRRYAQGTKQQNLSADIVGAFPICLPKIEEQKKIALILSEQDRYIKLLDRKIEQLQQMKKYCLAKMFPRKGTNVPEIRFPEFTDPWEQRKLGELVERVTRKNQDLESDLPLTISAQYGLIDQSEFFDKRIASKDVSGYYLVRKGEFAYNKSTSGDAPWGAVKRLDRYEKGVLSTLYIVFRIANEAETKSDYIATYYDTNLWHKDIQAIAAEGARNHGLLNIAPSDFFETSISIPKDVEEQKMIGQFFNELDSVIILHQRKRDEEIKKKKALMQSLLTGIVRVSE